VPAPEIAIDLDHWKRGLALQRRIGSRRRRDQPQHVGRGLQIACRDRQHDRRLAASEQRAEQVRDVLADRNHLGQPRQHARAEVADNGLQRGHVVGRHRLRALAEPEHQLARRRVEAVAGVEQLELHALGRRGARQLRRLEERRLAIDSLLAHRACRVLAAIEAAIAHHVATRIEHVRRAGLAAEQARLALGLGELHADLLRPQLVRVVGNAVGERAEQRLVHHTAAHRRSERVANPRLQLGERTDRQPPHARSQPRRWHVRELSQLELDRLDVARR
jgi:hypothetical protein